MKLKFVFAIALGAIASSGSSVRAQSASANVTAEVQSPITVTKNRDLEFEEVFPGVNKTVAVSDATSASFRIAAQANAQVQMTFTLPSSLLSGADTLLIDTWTGRYNTTNSAATGTDFTPSASAATATIGSGGELFLFIGATVKPTIVQVAGSYSATLQVTVVYF